MQPRASTFLAVVGVILLAAGLSLFYAIGNLGRDAATAPSPVTDAPSQPNAPSPPVSRPASPEADLTVVESLLRAAIETGRPELVRQHLDRLGEPDRRLDASGRTALILAASRGDAAVLRAVLAAGASVNASDHSGTTAIAAAAAAGSLTCVELLLSAGADPQLPDSAGLTPLHHAACSPIPEVVIALLNAGVDAARRDRAGRTALDHARARSDATGQMIAAILEQAGR